METFWKDFYTYLAVSTENGIDIVPLVRDGKDSVQALEDKRFPDLKTYDTIDLSATDRKISFARQKKKGYKDIYEK